jgi:hypothetical protein
MMFSPLSTPSEQLHEDNKGAGQEEGFSAGSRRMPEKECDRSLSVLRFSKRLGQHNRSRFEQEHAIEAR